MPEIRRDESAGTAGKPLPSHTRVAVIGGGVVGCSILFHLAKFGWKDVILLERQELTAGSSWHAAGMIHTLSSDPNISRLQGYTINLYKEIEKTSGQSVGLNNTGGFYLASTRDWYDYLKRERSKARYMGLDQEFISPREVAERHPLIDPKHYYAALWDELDGDLDPSGATYAFAKSARVHGAQYFTHTPVVETNQRSDGSWDVVTPRGTVHAEYVVNCGGLWAREVGEMAGAALPVQPMEHHYLITEPIPAIVERMGRGVPAACRAASTTRPTSISGRSGRASCSALTSRSRPRGTSPARRSTSVRSCCRPISTASPTGWRCRSSVSRRSARRGLRTSSAAPSPSAPTATP